MWLYRPTQWLLSEACAEAHGCWLLATYYLRGEAIRSSAEINLADMGPLTIFFWHKEMKKMIRSDQDE